MTKKKLIRWSLLASVFITTTVQAQTEFDAIMMNKRQFCSGFMYGHSKWDEYWEGTNKRNNLNLGTVTTESVMFMGAYGITDKLNIVAGVPYVWTKASAGTLAGMSGVQDVSAFIKWIPFQKTIGQTKLSLYAIGGISAPTTNYVVDHLPLSIGLGTTNLIGRGMVDVNYKRITLTGSASYIRRSNTKLDRTAYYDTEMHYTNEVEMPNAAQYQVRAGYRGRYLIAEALLTNWTTLGGFDITRQNMPFPSNRMNSTQAGVYFKYTVPSFVNLSILGSAAYTVAGRNVGQATSLSAGLFYAFYFKNKNAKK